MKYLEFIRRFCIVGFAAFAIILSPNALAIKKCKDQDGNWHYGDFAEEKCRVSKVTTLNDRGFVQDSIDAPKTDEEKKIEAERLKKEQEEAERLAREREEKERILSIYETEADIDRQRDNQLTSVENNIKVHRAYLNQMDSKLERLNNLIKTGKGKKKARAEAELVAATGRVEEYTEELKKLEIQKKAIAEKFAQEKKLYLELTKKD